ncbi:MAG: serine hydrolase [Burkholderiaceae bacterium]
MLRKTSVCRRVFVTNCRKSCHPSFKITLLSVISAICLHAPGVGAAGVGKTKAGRPAAQATSPKAGAKAPTKAAALAPRAAKGTTASAAKASVRAAERQTASVHHGAVRRAARVLPVSAVSTIIGRPSIGQAIGLHAVDDPLDLHSAVALVVDSRSGEPLFEKNVGAVLPIASISKLMTAMVVLDANQPSTDVIEISQADVDTERFSSSRLRVGSRLTRAEALQAALMASENRAANALGRYYPGGMDAFVQAMNRKAASLGMVDSNFEEPTGLSSRNVSNAVDLVRMVKAASEYPVIRQYSTSTELAIDNGFRTVSFHNTNRLVDTPHWDIGLQKTGYISEAGNCLVMESRIEGRPVIIVLLDSAGRGSRFADAQRIRRWIEDGPVRASIHPGKMTQSLTSLGS